MHRLHIHVSVPDLEQAIGFYSSFFAAEPSAVKEGYAKWMLDDPRVNFAVSIRTSEERTGLDHLGIQVETDEEFRDLGRRLHRASGAVEEEGCVQCCYAVSEKANVVDPAGLVWETFLTRGESPHWSTRPVEPDEA